MSENKRDVFTIKSRESDLRLIVSDVKGEYFTVTVVSNQLTATRNVCTYTDSHGFPNFLERLSLYEKPWDGEESWNGIEGEFKIFGSCSSLGVVTFRIQLVYYGRENWRVETELKTEMGQLLEIAHLARRLFGPSPY